MIVEELVAQIGLDFRGVDKLEKLQRSFEGFKLAILGVPAVLGAASAALTGLTVGVTNSVAEMTDFGAAIGASVENLQTLEFVARQNGATFDDVKQSLRVLTDTAGNAAKGNEQAMSAFSDLGVSVHNTNGRLKTADELLPNVADALARMQDPAARLSAAQNLLGRGAVKFLPSLLQGSKGLAEMREQAERMGLVFDEVTNKRFAALDDAMDMLKERGRGVGRIFAKAFLPVLEKQVAGMNKFLGGIADKLPEIARRTVSLVEGPFNIMRRVLEALQSALEGLGSFGPVLMGLAAGAAVLGAIFASPVVAIIALATLVAMIAEDIDKFLKGQKSLLGSVVGEWGNFNNALLEVQNTADGLLSVLARLGRLASGVGDIVVGAFRGGKGRKQFAEGTDRIIDALGLGGVVEALEDGPGSGQQQISRAVAAARPSGSAAAMAAQMSSPLSNEALGSSPISIVINAPGADANEIATKTGDAVRRTVDSIKAKKRRKQ